MVGSLGGTDSFFRSSGYSGVESHFGVGGDGTVWQWQDTERQADAQLEGNDDCISIETADHGPEFPSWSGSNVPAWTGAQIEAIAQITAWACAEHNIPCRLISNTRDSTKGIGYHRQGIDPYRDSGERYSTAFGKVCPGDRRVAQIPKVIARANEILNGEDDLSWNEDLTPGTSGNDITNLANETLPDNWGRHAADLLGYAASAFAWLKQHEGTTLNVRAQLKKSLEDAANRSNPYGRQLGDAIGVLISSRVQVELGPVSDRLAAIEDSILGSSADEIRELIQSRHDAAGVERQELSGRLDSITASLIQLQDLAEQHASGNLDAEAVAEALRSMLHEATAPAEEGETI